MKLMCVDKNKIEREFNLRIETTFEGYPRFVVTHPSIPQEFFEFILKPMDDGSHMVMMINAHGAYAGLGIPDAIIPFAANHLSTELRSSPTNSACGNYWRTPEATKVWERLVDSGKAEYDRAADVYRLV